MRVRIILKAEMLLGALTLFPRLAHADVPSDQVRTPGGGDRIDTRSSNRYAETAVPIASSQPLMTSQAPQNQSLFDPKNLIAWCVVPFDAKRRSPQERAAMLGRLGFTRFAYDWRQEHISTFDAEIEALKSRNIELTAWWFPTDPSDPASRIILDVIQRHKIRPQLWVMGSGTPTKTLEVQQQRIEQEAERIRQIIELAKPSGCAVHLYNHNGWFGQPLNEVAVIERLKQKGVTGVGMVYNFSHGHNDIAQFSTIWPQIRPYVVTVNVTGMVDNGENIIIPPSQGHHELVMMRVIEASGWHGPIGLIAEQGGDAEVTLGNYQRGLAWLAAELKTPSSGGQKPFGTYAMPPLPDR